MKAELKNYKPFPSLSEETLAFTATLYLDGKRACYLSNRGHGDPIRFEWIVKELESPFEEWCKAQPPIPAGPEEWSRELPMDAELYVSTVLIGKVESERWMRKQVKSKILFRLNGDDDDAYRTIQVGRKGNDYRMRAVAHVKTEYADKLVELHY